MNIDELIAIAEKQEELLQFDHFNRSDAWALGSLLAQKIQEDRLALSVSIRLANGLIIFQYLPEGTSLNNETWLTKKFNVVREFEASSLLNTLKFVERKWTLEGRGLDPSRYAWGGGGFPIRIKGTGVVGVIIASGLPHLQDHDILVDSIARHLKVGDVPRIPLDEKI